MVKKVKVNKFVKGFFEPCVNVVDLSILFLMMLIFSNGFAVLILFFVYYFFVSRPLVRYLGFEVVRWR